MSVSNQQLQALFAAARAAAAHAYAPYSGFRVGAALLFHDGAIVTGCNVENASYGLTLCAERAALVRAVSESGHARRLAAVAVSNLNSAPSPPCGACRQVLAEFATPETQIVFPIEAGAPSSPLLLASLLPHAFSTAPARQS